MSFRFENLLKLRKSQEYQAQKSFSSIGSQLISHQASLKLLKEAEKSNKQKYDQRLQQNIDIKTRRLFDKYFDWQKRQHDIKIAALEQLINKLENKRTELISAIKKTKSLEILKQRKLKNSKKLAMTIEYKSYEEDSTLWRGQFS